MAREKPQYDVSEVVRRYSHGEFKEKRHELVRELRKAMQGNPPVLELIGSILEHTEGKGHGSADTVGFSLLTGMAIGILLEQERMKREINEEN